MGTAGGSRTAENQEDKPLRPERSGRGGEEYLIITRDGYFGEFRDRDEFRARHRIFRRLREI